MSAFDHYEYGNSAFNNADYEGAITHYTHGIDECKKIQLLNPLFVKLLLNRSMCNLKLRSYDDVIKDCTEVLRLDCKSSKALLRRAMAFEYTGDFERGLDDLYELKELVDLPKSLIVPANQLITRLEALCKLDNEVMNNPTNDTDFIVTNGEQCLRLNLQDTIPDNEINLSNLTNNQMEFRVCVGNEFGLWNQHNLFCTECNLKYCTIHSVTIKCELIVIYDSTNKTLEYNDNNSSLSNYIQVVDSSAILNSHGKV